MVKFLFLGKLLFNKPPVSKQIAKWTPFIVQHNKHNDFFKTFLIGLPNYLKTQRDQLSSMRQNGISVPLNEESLAGISGFKGYQQYIPLENRQGDFKQIKNSEFVHSLSVVQNAVQMDDFKLDDLESVVSEIDENDSIDRLNESLVLSWEDHSEAGSVQENASFFSSLSFTR